MRLVFFGTPREAVPSLRSLAAEHDVAFVVTRPDRRRTRRGAPEPSPVRRAAVGLGLEVMTPRRAIEVVDAVHESGADVGVVVAYGQLLPAALLDAMPEGFVNLHFSLLPRWRGAAPVERAILAGDDETGVCVMAMDAGLDTGPVYACTPVAIGPRDTAGDLRAELVERGTELLEATLPEIAGRTPEPQRGQATDAPKLTVEEFALDWSRPAVELDRVVRAGNPRPGAWTRVGGKRLKVWEAEPVGEVSDPRPGVVDAAGVVAAGKGGLALGVVQPEGRPRMDITAWLAGRRDPEMVFERP